MSAAHTPGPWVKGPGLLNRLAVFAGSDHDCECVAMAHLCEADARLIAAAPQLVEALAACHYELLTLNPRLSAAYRKNVEACIEMAKSALAAAKETP